MPFVITAEDALRGDITQFAYGDGDSAEVTRSGALLVRDENGDLLGGYREWFSFRHVTDADLADMCEGA